MKRGKEKKLVITVKIRFFKTVYSTFNSNIRIVSFKKTGKRKNKDINKEDLVQIEGSKEKRCK